jgi:hypothetical protein
VKQELIDALRQLARGHMSAAEAVADILMPESDTIDVNLPVAELIEAEEAKVAKKKAK